MHWSKLKVARLDFLVLIPSEFYMRELLHHYKKETRVINHHTFVRNRLAEMSF